MTERNDLSLEAGADLVNHRLIKLSGGKAIYSTAAGTDNPVGITKLNAKSGEGTVSGPPAGGSGHR